jgi:glycosyltransferase involved in cell wall biosynthesis
MLSKKTFTFLSIDGMTDPLGQSQVIPYLIGLKKIGYIIQIISCEKSENWSANNAVIQKILAQNTITWKYCFYKTKRPFLSQIQNYLALKKLAIKSIKNNVDESILHCRSYLPALIGLHCKKKYKNGFIFDMRGFWADERIEGKIWNKNSLSGYLLYSFFKRKEKKMLSHADKIITLTYKAKDIISNWNLNISADKISVIRCCVDLQHFSTNKIDKEVVNLFHAQYPQIINKFILTYIGSLGTWYMADEMVAFFKILSNKIDAVFIIITKDDKNIIYKAAHKHQVDADKIIIAPSSRAEMPSYISLSSASLFFIKPTFSKLASSPTKMGELLSMGVPIIANNNIGDVDDIINQTESGTLISQFNDIEYNNTVNRLLAHLSLYRNNAVNTATKFFSLEDGVNKYSEIYKFF